MPPSSSPSTSADYTVVVHCATKSKVDYVLAPSLPTTSTVQPVVVEWIVADGCDIELVSVEPHQNCKLTVIRGPEMGGNRIVARVGYKRQTGGKAQAQYRLWYKDAEGQPCEAYGREPQYAPVPCPHTKDERVTILGTNPPPEVLFP